MYKSILLTENEIKLVRKVLHTYLDNSFKQIKNQEAKNLHIIDRTLLGSIPTKTSNEKTIRG